MSNLIVKDGKTISHEEARRELISFGVVKQAPTSVNQYITNYQNLPVDVRSLVNRPTDIKSLKKILSSRQGFDGSVWNAPSVAKVMNEGGIHFLFDGDHSRHLYRLMYPEAETMPMKVIEVQDMTDVHKLFTQANARGKTPMTAEQIFVHDVHGKMPKAVALAEIFSQVGIKIFCTHEENGTVGDMTNGYFMKYGAAKKIVTIAESANDLSFVRKSLELLNRTARKAHSSAWKNDSKSPVPAELTGGILLALLAWKKLQGGNPSCEFENWLKAKLRFEKPKQVSEDLKSLGGSIVNHPHYSIAKGIMKSINKDFGAFELTTRLTLTDLHKVYKDPSKKSKKKNKK